MTDQPPLQRSFSGKPPLLPLRLRAAAVLCIIAGGLTIVFSIRVWYWATVSPQAVMALALRLLPGMAACLGAAFLWRQQRLGLLLVVPAWACPALVARITHEHPNASSLLLFGGLLFAATSWRYLQ